MWLSRLYKEKRLDNLILIYQTYAFNMRVKNIADTNQGFIDRLKNIFDTKSLRIQDLNLFLNSHYLSNYQKSYSD